MSFELHDRKGIDDELRKIARRQLRSARDTLISSDPAALVASVHESRKAVKKVRAVLAVLERAGAKIPRRDRRRLRKAAHELATLRDSAASIDTFDQVRRHYPTRLPEQTYRIVRRGLVRGKQRQEHRARREGVLGRAAKQLDKTRDRAKHWTGPSVEIAELLAVVTASYRRSRRAMNDAIQTGQSATLHRWRKGFKVLWYQLRLAKPLTTGVAPFVAEMKRLESQLGEEHNLVVLVAMLRACPDLHSMRGEVRMIGRLSLQMRQALRKRAFALGRRLHRRKPRVFGQWLHRTSRQARARVAVA